MNYLKHAIRSLAKTPGFTIIAVLTLAVGIGMTSAIFSTLDAFVLRPYSYPQSERIAHLWSGDGWPLSDPDFQDIREQSTSFETLGSYVLSNANLGGDKPISIPIASATSGVLDAFGIPPLRGRLITREDEQTGVPPVIVISHALWQNSFASDPELVGKTIRINGNDLSVVGIMPEHFEFSSPWMLEENCELWVSRKLNIADGARTQHGRLGVGRLRPDVTVAEADAEIKAIGKQLSATYPDSNSGKHFLVRSLHDEMTKNVAPYVMLLFGAVVLVMLVACANVASMLLARSAQRQSEFGLRVALGAGRGEILNLVLAESLALSAMGAALGILIAHGGIKVLQAIIDLNPSRLAALDLNPVTITFAIGLAVVTTLFAGLPPALASTRFSLAGMLSEFGSRGSVGSRTRLRFLRSLIIAQIAIALMLANGATLLSNGYLKLVEDNQELASENILAVEVDLKGPRYREDSTRVQFWDDVSNHVSNLPGVSAAGIITILPLEGGSNAQILVDDEVFDPTIKRNQAEVRFVTSDYFAAADLSMLKGRSLNASDRTDGARGVVINRTLADLVWPDQNPLGKTIRSNHRPTWFTATVVGVVESTRQWGPEILPKPELYFAPPNAWGRTMNIVVRSPLDATLLAPAIRGELAKLDPDLPVARIRTFKTLVEQATAAQRVVAGLVNTLMVIALGLLGIGIYGTLSYSVLQRKREIGVRMALGAFHSDILRLVFRQGGMWAAIGIGLGVLGATWVGELANSIVYGADEFEHLSLLIATGVVALATFIACWLPARRATKVDPMEALRAE